MTQIKRVSKTIKTSVSLLSLSVVWGLFTMNAMADSKTAIASTINANNKGNPTTPDGKAVRSTNQPAQFNHVANKEAREYLVKYGRPPSIPLMTYVSMSALSGKEKSDLKVSSLFGVVRSSGKGNHYHGGHDFANQVGVGGRLPLYAPTSGSVFYSKNGGFGLIRDNLSTKDRVVHLHLKVASSKLDKAQGTQLQNYLQYGSPVGNAGTLIGYLHGLNSKGALDYAVHDHAEYHVRAGDPRVAIKLYRGVLKTAERNKYVFRDTKLIRSNSMIAKTDKNYRQIDIAPYMAYDSEIQNPEDWGGYAGNTLFTNFNNLYKTQLPEGLLAPTTKGGQPRKIKAIKKPLPITHFTQSAFANMDISMEQLGSANMGIMDYAINAENAGFDVQGQLITQKMLVSHMSDENGETWQSVFGTAESVNPSEMNQTELIRHLASKRLANSDWSAKISTLSDKGLFMEFMAQRAEINFMYGLLTKLKQEQLKQDAILASVMMNHKDKAVTDLGEAINASIAPDFAKIELEKKGDEWAIDEVYTAGNGYSGDGGAGVDVSKLPNDLQALSLALLEAVAGHESKGSYNAWNKGTSCKGLHLGREPHPYAPITQMTPAQILTRYYGKPYGRGESNAVSCSNRLFAVGKYQWIPKTLSDMITKPLFKEYLNQNFTSEVQDKLAPQYFFKYKRPNIGLFIQTGKGKHQAKMAFAQEWASVGVPQGGKREIGFSSGCTPSVCHTYYNRKGGNKAFYESTMKVWAILDKIEQYHQQKRAQ